MNAASRSSWATKPAPLARQRLAYERTFTHEEAERLVRGFVPREMEDKWFIFFEQDWLYFHRSWTGFGIFALRLGKTPQGMRITECWASRESSEYRTVGPEHEQRLLDQLIRDLLLGPSR